MGPATHLFFLQPNDELIMCNEKIISLKKYTNDEFEIDMEWRCRVNEDDRKMGKVNRGEGHKSHGYQLQTIKLCF